MNDPSLPKTPEGPRVPIRYRGPALILTSEVEDLSSAALQDAIRRRVPAMHFKEGPPAEPTKPGQRLTALGSYPDLIKAVEMGGCHLSAGSPKSLI
jgi:hypothetical protein